MSEDACLAFKTFWKFYVNYGEERSILILIRLDTLIKDAIDKFQEDIVDTESPLRDRVGKCVKNQSSFRDGYDEKLLKLNTKGGCIPQKAAEKLRALLPLASSQHLQKFRDIFVNSCGKIRMSAFAKLSFTDMEVANREIDNICRENTMIFRYPGNEQFYI